MSPKFGHLELVLIYFVLLLPWPQAPVVPLLCSKDNSRLVRKIVRSKWTPILDKHQVKLPLECPLHPFRDLFAPRQDAKKRDRPTQWTCRVCGKSFYQEKFLDQHFETRHRSIINEAEDAVCLADLCDIMRCDVFQSEEASSLRVGDQTIVTDIEVWGDSLGQNSALAKANAVYLSLMPLSRGSSRASKVQNRQLCQDQSGQSTFKEAGSTERPTAGAAPSAAVGKSLASNTNTNTNGNNNNNSAMKKTTPEQPDGGRTGGRSGAPAAATAATAANSAKANQMNAAKVTRKSVGESPETNVNAPTEGIVISKPLLEDGEVENRTGAGVGSPPSGAKAAGSVDGGAGSGAATGKSNNGSAQANNGNGNGNGNGLHRSRANCKAEELSKLKTKCERLVRHCIGGLLLVMTDQAFKDMEIEMNKAVCWYLSCDRYWEDGRTLEPRAFPWGLILILVLVLSTGICFCYYIIWILFDSEETTIINTNPPYGYGQYPAHMTAYGGYAGGPAAGPTSVIGATHGPMDVGGQMAPPPSYYYQQQQQQQQQQHQQQHHHQQQHQVAAHDLYPEQASYVDYRHSPRRYISEQRQQGTPAHASSAAGTPLHHATSASQQQQASGYPQDILDRRDYTSSGGGVSRPLTTTAVVAGNTIPQSASANAVSAAAMGPSASGGGGGGGGVRHYNTHPRPLASQHRHVGASQQSLRTSNSTHEIIQNEIGHNEHYIYVTYPPDLKKRYYEKYE